MITVTGYPLMNGDSFLLRGFAEKIVWKVFLISFLGVFSLPLWAAELKPLSDVEMGAVTGQKGILLSMEYYYNSDHNLGGAPNSSCSDDAGGSLADMDCRFAVQLKNRETEWLVFKNGYSSIHVRRLALDAGVLGDTRGSDSAYIGFFNAAKFKDVDGTCLLPNGNCSTATIDAMPGLRLSYPEGVADGEEFNDVRFGMFFEGLAVEANALAVDQPGWVGQSGWAGNNNGSFMGLNIADNNGYQAGIAFGGDFYMYGF